MRSLLAVVLLTTFACSGESPSAPIADASTETGDTGAVPDAPDATLAVDAAPDLPPDTTCNGRDAFCARRLDQYAFATTHNANNNREQGGAIPNQTFGLSRQLDDGIRALMIDVWEDAGVTVMCHANCRLGSRPLVDGLVEIDEWLRAHPRNVVVLLFETYVPPDDVTAAFEATGVADRVATLPAGQPLPTFAALIDAGSNLVVFTQDDGGDPAWYHPMWDWLHDNPYSASSTAEFTCDPLRGATTNPLLLINHFLTNPVGSEILATGANEVELLRQRVADCAAAFGQMPNFVAVDFYEIGGLLTVVDELNEPPP